jgi:hypothetical protein
MFRVTILCIHPWQIKLTFAEPTIKYFIGFQLTLAGTIKTRFTTLMTKQSKQFQIVNKYKTGLLRQYCAMLKVKYRRRKATII